MIMLNFRCIYMYYNCGLIFLQGSGDIEGFFDTDVLFYNSWMSWQNSLQFEYQIFYFNRIRYFVDVVKFIEF